MLLEEGHHAVYLIVAHERTMHPRGQAVAGGQVQHVAQAQQAFRAHLVENGAAVHLARYLKGNARGDVGLDETSNHVHARALRGEDQVDARCACLLCQAGDEFLDFLAHHHHQVGQFVDDNDQMWQALQRLGRFGREAERVGNQLFTGAGFGDACVVARQIAHAQLAHEAVAALHLAHTPVQAMRGLAHIRDHWRNQVRNAFVH